MKVTVDPCILTKIGILVGIGAYHDSENSSDIVLWEFLLERTEIQFLKTEKRGVFRWYSDGKWLVLNGITLESLTQSAI